MTSYRIEIATCPGCKTKLAVWGVASRNTIGAKFFTDGFVDGPMYDESGALLACPTCGTVFWRADMSISSSLSDTEFFRNADNRALPTAHKPKLASYPALAERSPWRTAEEEKYVRMRAWWAWNDDRRRDPSASESPLPRQATVNCERLLEILVGTDDDQTIMRAEICRELGRFQECLTQLDRPFPESYAKAVGVIRRLAGAGKCSVSQME